MQTRAEMLEILSKYNVIQRKIVPSVELSTFTKDGVLELPTDVYKGTTDHYYYRYSDNNLTDEELLTKIQLKTSKNVIQNSLKLNIIIIYLIIQLFLALIF